MPMTPAITIQNIPAHFTEALFNALLDGNRIHTKRVLLEKTSNGSGQTAYIWLKNDRYQSKAIQLLNECEVEDRLLTAADTDNQTLERLPKEAAKPEPRKPARNQPAPGEPLMGEPETIIAPGPSHDGEHEALVDLSEWRVPFDTLGLSPEILENIKKQGFDETTPIQGCAIPQILNGHDVVGRAQTGSGKTLAFALPMVELLKDKPGKGLRGLIVAPTRELAVQITEVIDRLIVGTGLKSIAIYGGDHILDQIVQLKESPDILIATPGRLLDIQSRGRFRIDCAEIIVLDEADRMLDMGFMPQIKDIFACFYEKPQVLLFSATLVEEIQKMRVVQLKNPVFIDVGAPDLTPLKSVQQEIVRVRNLEEKDKRLRQELDKEKGPIIVFVATKRETEKLCQRLKRDNYHATRIHGDIDQADRLRAVEMFKQGRYNILVGTDVASRGLDIEGVALIINYDLAMSPEDHIHRIGRTARAGASGKAVTLLNPQDNRHFHEFKTAFGL